MINIEIPFDQISCSLLSIPRVKARVKGQNLRTAHTTLCIQFLDTKNDKNNTWLSGKQICLTIVSGFAEILPSKVFRLSRRRIINCVVIEDIEFVCALEM